MALPDGVVTFLFTDIEGSTPLWEESPESMMDALRRHDAIIEGTAEEHHGLTIRPRGEGDSRFVVFPRASDAVAAAAEMQRRLAAVRWELPRPLAVRMAIHTGLAEIHVGDYYGSVVNRAARLRSLAHGGQTLISAATWELVRDALPPGTAVTDLGTHALKGLTRPEQVYQLDIDGLPQTFPPLASTGVVPTNLPTQLTDLIGRERDLADAASALAGTRLLTILAPGGSGKTRLAIQLAADLSTDFPDGVFFVDLAPLSTIDDITRAMAESLRIALSTDEDPLAQLLAYLGPRTLLLVFDNFEHLLDGADVASAVLRGAPAVKAIVTSRARLGVTGETVLSLPGLQIDWDSPTEAMETSGVQLFVNAAQRADATFSLSVDDLEPLREILRLVDGMPLAIELAAAWVDVLPITDIAAEIGASADFLESELGDIPARHRSVRNVFAYSWGMLTTDEQHTFSALSVHRGGFTRESAKAVAGASVRTLATLSGKSLITADRESGRYSIHELLRYYAAAELESDRPRFEAATTAHARFYAGIVSSAEEQLHSGDQLAALRMMEAELDNVRVGWRAAMAAGDAPTVRSYLVGMWFLHEIRGWHRAGAALFAEAAAGFPLSSDGGARVARGLAAASQGWFLAHLGRPEDGARLAEEAVAELAVLPDRHAHLRAIQNQIAALTYLNRWDEVGSLSLEAGRIAAEAGLEGLEAELLAWKGFADLYLGDLPGARATFDQLDPVLARTGDERSLSWVLIGLAILAAAEGRQDEAILLAERQIAIARRLGYRRAGLAGLQYLGEAKLAAGETQAAEHCFVEALEIAERMGQTVEMAGMLTRIAGVRVGSGRTEEAVSILASVLANPVSDRSLIADGTSLGAQARDMLADLEKQLEPPSYAAAHAMGAQLTIDSLTRELLDR